MIPEWSEKSFLYTVPSQFLSRQSKKFFVRVPSSISQCSEKANRIWPWSMVLAMGGVAFEQYKGGWFLPFSSSFHMSNIIPLPFKSALSSSYADASELAQAMQRLEHHLAHVVNIWVTSKCSFPSF